MHTLQMFGRELNRREWVFDVVCNLARHVGPRLQLMRAPEFGALVPQSGGHAVEVRHQSPQLVGGVGDDADIEATGCDLPRGASEAGHRVSHSLRDPGTKPGGEQHDADSAKQHAAVEVGDFALNLLLSWRQRHRQHRLPAQTRHGGGGNQVGEWTRTLFLHKRRDPIEGDGAIGPRRCAFGQDA